MAIHQVSFKIGDSDVIIETGKLAKQASGAVTVRCGDTIILVTTTSDTKPKDCDFLPLTVEYLEKTYAAGRFPGGFIKRETRPSDAATLVARCVDRPIRPLFPEHYHCETQVVTYVLSACAKTPPEFLAIIGSSAALHISDIPLKEPVAGCRVSRINGQFKINVAGEELAQSDLNLVVAATESAVVMVEGEAKVVAEEDVIAAIEFAHKAVQPAIAAQKELRAKCGKPKREVVAPVINPKITSAIQSKKDQVKAALAISDKLQRYGKLSEIKDELKKAVLTDESPFDDVLQFGNEFEGLKSDLMRHDIIKAGKRIDGRGLKDIRPISCEVGLLPRTHGSALFTRGETQALAVITLGSSDDEQRVDNLFREVSKTFLLNYNFPGFSVGEVKPFRSPGRREIGHGFLAEKALSSQLPDIKDFPYTIRLVSEILESNGSSSMATVCGGSLAMMDAGIPVKSPVAGIAMGLIKEGNDFAILSDILGDEDHLGDMDFKVTGNEHGVTAIQMDIKIDGLTSEIMFKALQQAKEGRKHILSKMREVIAEPRKELCSHAPRVVEMWVSTDRIKDVIGPGGKHIKGIVEKSGAKIDIDDTGLVRIFAGDGEGLEIAQQMIRDLTAEAEIGKLYKGEVKKIMNFGAFVEILPKTDGLLHISEISKRRIREVTDVLKEGDVITVKVLHVDQAGKIKLSMKDVEQQDGHDAHNEQNENAKAG